MLSNLSVIRGGHKEQNNFNTGDRPLSVKERAKLLNQKEKASKVSRRKLGGRPRKGSSILARAQSLNKVEEAKAAEARRQEALKKKGPSKWENYDFGNGERAENISFSGAPILERVTQEVASYNAVQRGRAPVNLKERITLLQANIEIGKRQAAQLEAMENPSPIMIIGSTGAGKSTLVNCLSGCEMEIVQPEDVGGGLEENLIAVASTSAKKPVAKIGHSNQSETFLPQLVLAQEQIYCDCPGFSESRGPEISIANIINTKAIIDKSHSIRMMVLINFYEIDTMKGRGLRDTLASIMQFFGSQEAFAANKHAIVTCVTHIPTITQGQRQRPIDSLRRCLLSLKNTSPFEKEVLTTFANTLFIYSPTGEPERLRYAQALTASLVAEKLEGMGRISVVDHSFGTVMSAKDELALRNIYSSMKGEVEPCLRRSEYETVNNCLKEVYKIRGVDHPLVTSLVDKFKGVITQHFQELTRLIDEELAKAPGKHSLKADQFLEEIEQAMLNFSSEDAQYFIDAIDLEGVKKRVIKNKQ